MYNNKVKIVFLGVMLILTFSLSFGLSNGTFTETPINSIKAFSSTSAYGSQGFAALVLTSQYGNPGFMLWLYKDSDGSYKNLLALLIQAKTNGNTVNIEYSENGGHYTITGIEITK